MHANSSRGWWVPGPKDRLASRIEGVYLPAQVPALIVWRPIRVGPQYCAVVLPYSLGDVRGVCLGNWLLVPRWSARAAIGRGCWSLAAWAEAWAVLGPIEPLVEWSSAP